MKAFKVYLSPGANETKVREMIHKTGCTMAGSGVEINKNYLILEGEGVTESDLMEYQFVSAVEKKISSI